MKAWREWMKTYNSGADPADIFNVTGRPADIFNVTATPWRR